MSCLPALTLCEHMGPQGPGSGPHVVGRLASASGPSGHCRGADDTRVSYRVVSFPAALTKAPRSRAVCVHSSFLCHKHANTRGPEVILFCVNINRYIHVPFFLTLFSFLSLLSKHHVYKACFIQPRNSTCVFKVHCGYYKLSILSEIVLSLGTAGSSAGLLSSHLDCEVF